MATHNIKLEGSEDGASQLIKYAIGQKDILFEDMGFQEINVSSRKIVFPTGAEIKISTVFGHSEISIYCPPDKDPIPPEPESMIIELQTVFGEIALAWNKNLRYPENAILTHMMVSTKIDEETGDYLYDVRQNDPFMPFPGQISDATQGISGVHSVEWRSQPYADGSIDVVSYLGPKGRYGNCDTYSHQVWDAESENMNYWHRQVVLGNTVLLNGMHVKIDLIQNPAKPSYILGGFTKVIDGKKYLYYFLKNFLWHPGDLGLTQYEREHGFDTAYKYECSLWRCDLDVYAEQIEEYSFKHLNVGIAVNGQYNATTNPGGSIYVGTVPFDEPSGGYGEVCPYGETFSLIWFPVVSSFANKFYTKCGGSATYRLFTINQYGISVQTRYDGRFWDGVHYVWKLGMTMAADSWEEQEPSVSVVGLERHCSNKEFYEKTETTSVLSLEAMTGADEIGVIEAMDFDYKTNESVALVARWGKTFEHILTTEFCTNFEACCDDDELDCEFKTKVEKHVITRAGAFIYNMATKHSTLIFTYDQHRRQYIPYPEDEGDKYDTFTNEEVWQLPVGSSDIVDVGWSMFTANSYGYGGRIAGQMPGAGIHDEIGNISFSGNCQIMWADLRQGLVMHNVTLYEFEHVDYDWGTGTPESWVATKNQNCLVLRHNWARVISKAYKVTYNHSIEPYRVENNYVYDELAAVCHGFEPYRQLFQIDNSSFIDEDVPGGFDRVAMLPASFTWVGEGQECDLIVGQAAGYPGVTGVGDEIRFHDVKQYTSGSHNNMRFMVNLHPEELDTLRGQLKKPSGDPIDFWSGGFFRDIRLIRRESVKSEKLYIEARKDS
ncbi:MAG: hypothetical protein KAH23_01675 [Kiritimatiellae bacterium]|nr:hypothetical protein [Kiritimatiellia bacterium]